jgi:radical SAM-linked protein
VTRKFLVREKVRADRAAITEDCRLEDVCFSCGVSECPQRPWVKTPHAPIDLPRAHARVEQTFGRARRRGPARTGHRQGSGVQTATRFRITFEKGTEMRFTSHLDLMRTWERSLRRAGVPLAFTQGHRPHLKLSFGPPLPLGYRSRAEAFDLEFSRPPDVDLAERFNEVLPPGLRVVGYRPILFKTPSLMSQLGGATYGVRFPRPFLEGAGLDAGTLGQTLREGIRRLLDRDHLIVRRQSEAQTREFDAKPSILFLEASDDETPAALTLGIRFTVRAQPRPDEVVAMMFPDTDIRSLDVERMQMWAEVGEQRLDPLALLQAGTG